MEKCLLDSKENSFQPEIRYVTAVSMRKEFKKCFQTYCARSQKAYFPCSLPQVYQTEGVHIKIRKVRYTRNGDSTKKEPQSGDDRRCPDGSSATGTGRSDSERVRGGRFGKMLTRRPDLGWRTHTTADRDVS